MIEKEEVKKTIIKLDKYLTKTEKIPYSQFSFKDHTSYTFYRGKLFAYAYVLQQMCIEIDNVDTKTDEWLKKILKDHKRYIDY